MRKARKSTMELWLVDLEASAGALAGLERQLPRLTAEDRDRASKLVEVRERRWRLTAYAALRLLLERAGAPGARGSPFVRSTTGKPALAGAEVTFSLSHTTGFALIGLTSSGTDIGVDLESARRPVIMAQRRRVEIMAAAAGLAGGPLPKPEDDASFLQAWSRLEAYAKARGQGLARLLAELGLRGGGPRTPLPQLGPRAAQLARRARLKVQDLELRCGLLGAIALAEALRVPGVRRFPSSEAEMVDLVSAATFHREHGG